MFFFTLAKATIYPYVYLYTVPHSDPASTL
jgi:hypothetical protein